MVWPMDPYLSVHLVDVVIGVVPFSQYASSPLLCSDCNVDSVADKLIGLVEGRGASMDTEPVAVVVPVE